MTKSIEVLQQWSIENPDEKVGGVYTTYDAPYLRESLRPPVSELLSFVLCGYNIHDRQIRVRWFDHIRV